VVHGVEVLLAESEMGTESPGGATLTTIDLIDAVSPDYAMSVGICYGLRANEQSLGDIIVSTQLRVMDSRKVMSGVGEETVEILRGDKVSSSVLLLDRCRSAQVDWAGARIHFGLLLSANTLVNSKRLVDRLKALEPDAVGGEMEGSGIYAAAAKRGVPWIVVKGICDWGFEKSDLAQPMAAQNAASYTMHVIASGGLAAPPSKFL
jgi:nucleoside phosphorylase